MKKSKAETAETRKRIVEVAAKEFRKNGIEATGVAHIMAVAGLSHGGFYRHFESKEQLVTEALSATPKNMVRDLAAASTKSAEAVLAVVTDYMTSNYRDNIEDGCPLAAMGSELVHASDQTRHAATNSLSKMVDAISPFMRAREDENRHDLALSLMTNMVGALTVARLVDNPELSDRILAVTQRRIYSLFDTSIPAAQQELPAVEQSPA